MSNPLADMEHPDVIFCIGTNMTEAHPVAATRLKKAMARGAKLIVADPRRIELAERAHLYLPIRVGSDTALLLAMAHVIAREGLVNQAFLADRTVEGDAFLEHVKDFTPAWASEICEVPAEDIEQAALWYAKADRGAIFYTLGITEHVCGVENVQSLCNLALMTGHVGREGTGINPMRGQNNIQGAGDMGAIPNNYPGFQPVTDPANQAKFEKAWGTKVDLEVGITKITMLDQAGDQIRAVLIDGENTVVSDADRGHAEKALRKLDFLVVCDLFLTDTAELADVVFPAAGWAEVDGTQTNTERRVQRLRAAVPPQGEAKPDWWILSQLARRMGFQGFDYESAKDVFNEMCALSTTYAGLDWDKVEHGAYHWPVPYDGHPGTPRLHEDTFENGRGIFKRTTYRDPAEVVDDDYPVWLTTGRRLQAYHTHTQTGRTEGIEYLLPGEALEIHPEDVTRLGLTDGGMARVTSRRGSVDVPVKATARSPRGTVFLSFSFADVPVNVLTGGGYDPVTQTPEVKVCPVRVEPIATGSGPERDASSKAEAETSASISG